MAFSKMRSMMEEANKRRHRGRGGSQYLTGLRSPAPSFSTQASDDLDSVKTTKLLKPPTDAKMLQRARDVHMNVDFEAMSAGPESGGPWGRVEAVDRFVVFKHRVTDVQVGDQLPGLEVMCAGRLDASLEEMASVLRSGSDADFTTTMQGLYSKKFVFGSLDRDVPCCRKVDEGSCDHNDDKEQLTVKTCSFMRTTMFTHNEQWCFFEFFQRKKDHDGFTISQCALPPREPTPGRIVRDDARVNQLHGLNASYLVDKLPNRKGLRVVFKAWFEKPLKSLELNAYSSFTSVSTRCSSRASSFSTNGSIELPVDSIDAKAQGRRLLALARGVTKLPELIRRRRFGMQVPADFDAIEVSNARCPCCTHSLAPVKLSIALAASALAKRSVRSLRMDTRRCYLCGYRVCLDCWSAEYMESGVGKVAAIVVCSRCNHCVKACDYSEVCASSGNSHHGPVRVVEDSPDSSPAPLLVDFLAASLMEAPVGADRAAVVSVVRTLLRQSESEGDSDYDSSVYSDDDEDIDYEELGDNLAVKELGSYLQRLPGLENCVLASAERRAYTIDLPDDPVANPPQSVIPSHDNERLKLITDTGLLQLAYQLAPLVAPDSFDDVCNVQDLELLCQLAVRATGCSESFVTVMGVKHNHILAATHPGFCHAAVPREQTMCQHTVLTTKPFVATHPEADVRFHAIEAVKQLGIRYYVGFPVTVPTTDESTEMPVGTLCCIDTTARFELTRSQYVTMKRLTDTASRLIQLKGRRLRDENDLAPRAA